jgi:hypothetical protein
LTAFQALDSGFHRHGKWPVTAALRWLDQQGIPWLYGQVFGLDFVCERRFEKASNPCAKSAIFLAVCPRNSHITPTSGCLVDHPDH